MHFVWKHGLLLDNNINAWMRKAMQYAYYYYDYYYYYNSYYTLHGICLKGRPQKCTVSNVSFDMRYTSYVHHPISYILNLKMGKNLKNKIPIELHIRLLFRFSSSLANFLIEQFVYSTIERNRKIFISGVCIKF